MSSALAEIVYDPQTSGGLLVALPAAEAPDLVAALDDARRGWAAVIGAVRDGDGRIHVQ